MLKAYQDPKVLNAALQNKSWLKLDVSVCLFTLANISMQEKQIWKAKCFVLRARCPHVGTLLRFLLWIRFNPVLCIECSFMVREHNFHELPSPPFFTLLFNYYFLICDFFLCQQVNLIFWYRVTFLTYTRSAQWNANLSYVDSRGFQNEILLYKYHTF